MATTTFKKGGKFSKHEKMKGDGKSMRLSRPGAKKECEGAPDPMERQYARRYRKTALGDQQYSGEPEGGFADEAPMMGMFRGY